ncbi:MAG TPA: hypothetical protein VEY30_07865 [Myxococcaceae bacterium]|nr:hypothetical protein [Myxococcaceae bacterium]
MIAAAPTFAALLCIASLPDDAIPGRVLRVGDWVTYRLVAGPGREHFLRLAVVGRESGSEKSTRVWLELETGTHPEMAAPIGRLRALIDGSGQGAGALHRLVFSPGFDPPSEVPVQSSSVSPAPLPPASVRVERGGTTMLPTRAGVVRAFPVSWSTSGEVIKRLWLSGQVPLWGLVRWELPTVGRSVELWAFGTGAASRVPEPAPTGVFMEGGTR